MYRFSYVCAWTAFASCAQANLEPSSCFGVIGGIGWGGSYLSSKGGTLKEGFASSDVVSFSRAGNTFTSQQAINFAEYGFVKNRCGFSYLVGLWGQFTTPSKILLAYSLNVGQIGSRSNISYPVGQVSYTNTAAGAAFSSSDQAVFSGRDVVYFSQLVHIGYVFGRVNPFLSLGVSEHIMKFSSLNAFGKSSQGVNRTYTMPVLGAGCNMQLSSRISVGVQLQRHFGTTHKLQNIGTVLPDTKAALGYPTIKTASYVALVHIIYGWTYK
jgi:hypothetical protein